MAARQPEPQNEKTPRPFREAAFCSIVTRKEEFFVLCRPGSDLLSQGLSHSTIGAEEFNGRVRDGIGLKLLARTTRPAKDKDTKQAVVCMETHLIGHPSHKRSCNRCMDTENESNQANRTISTGKLH